MNYKDPSTGKTAAAVMDSLDSWYKDENAREKILQIRHEEQQKKLARWKQIAERKRA